MSAYDLTLGTGQSAIRFDGGAGIVGARHGWGLQNLTDWMSLSDAKNDVNERALQHGAFDPGQTTRQSALITATVAYVGSTVAELEQAIYALNGLTAEPAAPLRATFRGAAGETHRDMTNIEITVPSHRGRSRLSDITIDMTAIDPRAYGAESTNSTGMAAHGGGLRFPLTFPVNFGTPGTDGRVRFTNTGTATTYLTLVVTGGMSQGFSLKRVETGQTITISRPINMDDTVTLETYYGTVLLNNQSSLSGFLTEYDWFQCPPGETCTVQFTPLGTVTGTPTLTMTTSPAWW